MQIHDDLVQGTPAWDLFRLEHDGSSEIAAVLGLSKNTTRNELLKMKHLGIAKEFSQFVQERVLDKGHEKEALARPIAEHDIGEDLYPVTCSDGSLSCSCDGLTMDGSIAWEHKQWNEALFDSVLDGKLPDEHWPQCQQILMVTGAKKLIFAVSDGEPENYISMAVYPDTARFAEIVAAWDQFHVDLENYAPVEIIEKPKPTPTMNLPAVSVQVQGSIALISNLDVFGMALRGFIARIPDKPSTDQEFSDCKAAIGKLKEAEEALDAAEHNAMGQMIEFDEMRRLKTLLFDLSRTTRLATEKLVTKREADIKTEIIQEARDKFAKHIAELNTALGKPYMPLIVADFVGVIKNKRTVSSLLNSVDTELARVKIESNAHYVKIEQNMKSLRELAKDHAFLFADTAVLVLKANDDLIALIKVRIAEHETAKAAEAEALRTRIAAEEKVKAEAAAAAEVQRQVAAERAKEAETLRQDREDLARHQREYEQSLIKDVPKPVEKQKVVQLSVAELDESSDSKTIINLSHINAALGFNVTARFLGELGFPGTQQKQSVIFRESDFPKICAAIVAHIQKIYMSKAA